MVQLLRLVTAGSVDDGKSTLIGRLLFDSKLIPEDQLSALEKSSSDRGEEYPNLALLTDGLRAEWEQGITIDVAHRYFSTPYRKFILADAPGHIQYTRNMVTGASTANLVLILIDARNGVLEQSRRHAFLASLLGIPHLVVCINKMDLVGYSAERFNEICEDFRRFAMKLEIVDLSFIPVSALHGDNIVHRSAAMPWYEGSSLLHQLEQVHVASDRNLIDARFPVQYVIRPQRSTGDQWHDYRGYAGTISGGVFKPGDEVTVLPSGFTTAVRSIVGPGGIELMEAFPPQAVTMQLEDHIDVGRGDLICRPGNRPHIGQDLDAMVCWFTDQSSLRPGSKYTAQHTTRSTRAVVRQLDYRLDINTLHRDESAESLSLNEIGRVRLRTQQPLLFDPYRRNRETGSFILIDETTNNTVAAGMITGPRQQESHVAWHSISVSGEEQASRGMIVGARNPSNCSNSSHRRVRTTMTADTVAPPEEAARAHALVDAHNATVGAAAMQIGILTPLTLPGDPTAGQLIVQGAVLGARFVNENPGQFSARQVRLVLEDDQKTADVEHMSRSAAGGMAKLALLDRVSAVIGQWHLRTAPTVANLAEQLGVPTFVENGHNTITYGRRQLFRTYFSIADRAPLMAGFAAVQGWKRIAVIAADTVFGQMLADTVIEACSDTLPGLEVFRADFPQDEVTDLDDLLAEANDFTPDALINAGVVRTNYMVVASARKCGLLPKVPMMACFPFPMRSADYWRFAGDAGAGVTWPAMRFSPTWPGLTPIGRWFVDTYLAEFASYPADNALNAFTDVTILAQAAALAGSSERAALHAALESGSFRTWRGQVRFPWSPQNGHHNSPELVLMHYQNVGDDADSSVIVWPPEQATGDFRHPAQVIVP